MEDEPASKRTQALLNALQYLESAMELLDGVGAPAQIAAHVDLAVCQLKDVIWSGGPQAPQMLPPRIGQ